MVRDYFLEMLKHFDLLRKGTLICIQWMKNFMRTMLKKKCSFWTKSRKTTKNKEKIISAKAREVE